MLLCDVGDWDVVYFCSTVFYIKGTKKIMTFLWVGAVFFLLENFIEETNWHEICKKLNRKFSMKILVKFGEKIKFSQEKIIIVYFTGKKCLIQGKYSPSPKSSMVGP